MQKYICPTSHFFCKSSGRRLRWWCTVECDGPFFPVIPRYRVIQKFSTFPIIHKVFTLFQGAPSKFWGILKVFFFNPRALTKFQVSISICLKDAGLSLAPNFWIALYIHRFYLSLWQTLVTYCNLIESFIAVQLFEVTTRPPSENPTSFIRRMLNRPGEALHNNKVKSVFLVENQMVKWFIAAREKVKE